MTNRFIFTLVTALICATTFTTVHTGESTEAGTKKDASHFCKKHQFPDRTMLLKILRRKKILCPVPRDICDGVILQKFTSQFKSLDEVRKILSTITHKWDNLFLAQGTLDPKEIPHYRNIAYEFYLERLKIAGNFEPAPSDQPA